MNTIQGTTEAAHNKKESLYLTKAFILYKLGFSSNILDVLQTLITELNLFKKVPFENYFSNEKSLRESLEELFRVFDWRINGEISEEEFSVLFNEWLKSKRAVFACTTFFKLDYMDRYLADDVIYLLKKNAKGAESCITYLSNVKQLIDNEYNNYLTTVPILGFALDGEKVSAQEPEVIEVMEMIFTVFDPTGCGNIHTERAFLVFLALIFTNPQIFSVGESFEKDSQSALHNGFEKFLIDCKCFQGRITLNQFKMFLLFNRICTKQQLMAILECSKVVSQQALNICSQIIQRPGSALPNFLDYSIAKYHYPIYAIYTTTMLPVTDLIKNSPEMNLINHFLQHEFFRQAEQNQALIGLFIKGEEDFSRVLVQSFSEFYGRVFLSGVKLTFDLFSVFLSTIKNYNELSSSLLQSLIQANKKKLTETFNQTFHHVEKTAQKPPLRQNSNNNMLQKPPLNTHKKATNHKDADEGVVPKYLERLRKQHDNLNSSPLTDLENDLADADKSLPRIFSSSSKNPSAVKAHKPDFESNKENNSLFNNISNHHNFIFQSSPGKQSEYISFNPKYNNFVSNSHVKGSNDTNYLQINQTRGYSGTANHLSSYTPGSNQTSSQSFYTPMKAAYKNTHNDYVRLESINEPNKEKILTLNTGEYESENLNRDAWLKEKALLEGVAKKRMNLTHVDENIIKVKQILNNLSASSSQSPSLFTNNSEARLNPTAHKQMINNNNYDVSSHPAFDQNSIILGIETHDNANRVLMNSENGVDPFEFNETPQDTITNKLPDIRLNEDILHMALRVEPSLDKARHNQGSQGSSFYLRIEDLENRKAMQPNNAMPQVHISIPALSQEKNTKSNIHQINYSITEKATATKPKPPRTKSHSISSSSKNEPKVLANPKSSNLQASTQKESRGRSLISRPTNIETKRVESTAKKTEHKRNASFSINNSYQANEKDTNSTTSKGSRTPRVETFEAVMNRLTQNNKKPLSPNSAKQAKRAFH